METNIQQKLKEYISDELKDSALYKELAIYAPDEEDRRLLAEFSEDEKKHAETFGAIYRGITGKSYTPEYTPPVIHGDLRTILQERVLNESGDFRKYGEQGIIYERNTTLHDAFERARTDEGVHALRLLYMLSK